MIRPHVRRLFRLGVRHADVIARETREEIEAHLRERAEQLERRGLPPEEAMAEARRRFGLVAGADERLVRAATRRERRLGLAFFREALGQDLRAAVRGLRRDRALTAVVVVLIALGTGANAAMFGILDRLLLSGPPHVEDPRRVVRLDATVDVPEMGTFTDTTFAYAAYEALRDGTVAFSGLGAYTLPGEVVAGSGESAEPIAASHATASLFPLLGVTPEQGRFFGEGEDRVGSPPVVVLGDEWWRRRFEADPRVVGSTVLLDGQSFTVVGVAPPGFTGAQQGRVDAWVPMAVRGARMGDAFRTTWDWQWLKIVGRLAPGADTRAAAAEATARFRAAFAGSDEPFREARLAVRPLWFGDAGEEAREVGISRWLVGVAAVVLLVAVANAANLLLARAVRRRREIAVRLALGSGRARLARFLVVESLLLAALGGTAALAILPVVSTTIRRTLLPEMGWTGGFDARSAAVAVGLALVCGVLAGLVPLLRTGRGLTESLRGGAREGGAGTSGLRTGLAVAQAALSVLLLVGAGLFVRSFRAATDVDLGVEADRVVTVAARWPQSPALSGPDGSDRRRERDDRVYRAVLERVRGLPRVEAAALAIGTPFQSQFQTRTRVPGRDDMPRLPGGGPYIQAVSPGYFETVGLDLVAGRVFAETDRPDGARLAIVNRTMAETLWPGGDALGECLLVGGRAEAPPPCARIVGVVEDAHRLALVEEPAMQSYVPLGQESGMGGLRLLVRPRGEAPDLFPDLRGAVRQVDPSVHWVELGLMSDPLAPQLRPWRLGATLVGLFGALALVIASIGLYSLLAHLVASRRHEIAIRSALGADRRDLRGLVVRRGLRIAGAGLALGLGLAALVGPRVAELLFDVSPWDPLVYGFVVVTLAATALVASLGPGRRAAAVEPAAVLRDE